MDDSTNLRTQAIASLSQMLFERVCRASDLGNLEREAIDIGHEYCR